MIARPAKCRAFLPIALILLAATAHAQPVPAGFDPLTASAADLATFGFPPRPDAARAPDAYASWHEGVAGMQRITPTLQQVPIRHGPMRHAHTTTANATSSNWSGYVAAAPAYNFGGQSMIAVSGDWMLPIAQPAFGACAHTPNGADVYSSTWVGLDGDGSPDVLQAGTEADAVCSQGQVAAYQGAWFEWYPNDETRITNLPATPGAAMYIHVWASSATEGHAYIANKSAHTAVAIAFAAPPGTQLTGNSAEWIVERPLVNGAEATLTNYVQVFLGNAQAFDAQKTLYYPGNSLLPGRQPALQIMMTDAANQIVSVPTLLGLAAMRFTDQGSARHTPM